MTVEVRFHVIRDGKEVGMYTSKKEADAHDKMLDIAENLFTFIEGCETVKLDDNTLDELTVYLSRHREEVIRVLKGTKPKTVTPQEPQETQKPTEAKEKKSTRKSTDKKKIRAV